MSALPLITPLYFLIFKIGFKPLAKSSGASSIRKYLPGVRPESGACLQLHARARALRNKLHIYLAYYDNLWGNLWGDMRGDWWGNSLWNLVFCMVILKLKKYMS